MIARLRLTAALLPALVLSLALPAGAQKLLDRDKPASDPANDPYTQGGKPELIKAAGYASMGGFEFGPEPDTAETVAEFLGYLEIKWIETEHFEIGVALPKVKVKNDERDKIRAELERLVQFFPDINVKARSLDPWLRAHLYAMRVEDHYDAIQELLGVTDDTFKDNTEVWDTRTVYNGVGPYLGQIGKFEVLLLPSEGAAKDFLRGKLGLTTKLSQRWNFMERDTMSLMVHTDQGGLGVDEALHGHVLFNLTHMLLHGYKHYSYDLPVWIREGLAHWYERKLNPRFNTFDSAEGSAAEETRKANWRPPTLKMVKADKNPSMARLIGIRSFADLELSDHFATWSIADYLMTVHPEFLRTYFHSISGLKDANNIDDPSTIPDVQRALFKDELKMTYASFERAWKAWVIETY